jgi:hypothetical protein
MWEFAECIGIVALMILPFVGLFALMGRLGADIARPQRQHDEHESSGHQA